MNFETSDGQPELTVIVPYFNQPGQLATALHDLHTQREIDLEVIVVDDASEKSCQGVVDDFQQKGLNITLLRQGNRSYTLAGRLLGMKNATGAWLAFMDADDRLAGENVFAQTVACAKKMQADILHFRTLAVDRDGFESHWPYAAPFYNGKLQGRAIFSTWLEKGCPAHSVWNKLYSRDLYLGICDLKHDLRIYRIEDFYLSAHFIFFARSYASCNHLVYKYFLPGGTHLAKAAGRAFDAMRMYLEFPGRFAAFGLEDALCGKLRDYLRALVALNGGRMCRFLSDKIWKNKPFELDYNAEDMRAILQYGSRADLFCLLAIANASNVRKMRDIKKIIQH